jgi:hypothetical protein
MNPSLKEDLDAILGKLSARGVLRIKVSYFGNDNKGEIESTEYFGTPMTDEDLDWKFSDLLVELLNAKCPLWDSEAGSYGKIHIYMPEGLIQIVHTQEYRKHKKNIIDIRF